MDSNAVRSWGTSTVIDNSSYVTGLFWQPLQNKDDPYGEIEEASEGIQEGSDLFTIKTGKVVQFGVCASVDGYKKGNVSLAVSVATALPEYSSFLAVFKVDNGWWYCCVRNDIILSDGDVLFLKEEDAKDQFMSMLAVPDWGKKYAPAEWGVPDTEVGNLSSIIGNGRQAKLQKIRALRGPKLYAVLAVSAVVGFWLLSSFVTDVLFAPPKRPVIVAPVKPKIMKPIVEQKKVILPWETLKNPEYMMKYCYRDVLQLLSIMPPGWKIGGLTCSDVGVTTSWRLEIGRIAMIDKALRESKIKFAARSISQDGKTVIASTYYRVPTMKSPPVYGATETINIINDLFQALASRVSVSEQEITVGNGTAQRNARNGEAQKYKIVKFTFQSQQNPLIWLDILTKFSGLQVNMIKYNADTGTWNYEGAIYVL